jgi:hypothetical protein
VTTYGQLRSRRPRNAKSWRGIERKPDFRAGAVGSHRHSSLPPSEGGAHAPPRIAACHPTGEQRQAADSLETRLLRSSRTPFGALVPNTVLGTIGRGAMCNYWRSEMVSKRRSGATSKINDLELKTRGPWSTGSEKIAAGDRERAPSAGWLVSRWAQKHRGFWPYPEDRFAAGHENQPSTARRVPNNQLEHQPYDQRDPLS